MESLKQLLVLFFPVLHILPCKAQDCSGTDYANTFPKPGMQVDAAHCEWPQQKAHWLDQLKTPASKAFGSNTLTAIETLEKQSRKNYTLTGCVLKTSFGMPPNAQVFYGNAALLSYDLNLGCYEYFCVKNKVQLSTEYAMAFRAYINRYTGIVNAFQFADDNPYAETYGTYNGRFIALCNFIKKDVLKEINNGKGYYQDIPESSTKPGSRSTYMTRHWYFTKPGIQPFVPVTRKEYLEALLVFYEREKLDVAQQIVLIEKESAGMMKDPVKFPQLYENGKKNLTVRKARFPDWQQKIETKKAIVRKALKENTAGWLNMPAVVKPKNEIFRWQYAYGPGAKDIVEIETRFADSKEDAQKTGSFTFSGFWDDKGGIMLYKYNPDYFKGAEKNPVKPYLIELTYRYLNIPLGKSLVENFTGNFDFDAVRNILE